MSKYLTFDHITFADCDTLLLALADVGYTTVEQGAALPLYGYLGDRRDETAEIVIRRKHIGSASNDVGFRRTDAGFVPVVSDYDRRYMKGGKFLVALRTAYNERAAQRLAEVTHGAVTRRVEGSKVKITIRR